MWIVVLAAGLVSSVALAGPVNVNAADAKTLAKELAGVGPKTAEAIVKERETGGPFKSPEDLGKRVKGVGPKTLAENKDNIKLADK
jgi:competence protein ComEA